MNDENRELFVDGTTNGRISSALLIPTWMKDELVDGLFEDCFVGLLVGCAIGLGSYHVVSSSWLTPWMKGVCIFGMLVVVLYSIRNICIAEDESQFSDEEDNNGFSDYDNNPTSEENLCIKSSDLSVGTSITDDLGSYSDSESEQSIDHACCKGIIRNSSYASFDCSITSHDDSVSGISHNSSERRLRFADEEGKSIEIYHLLEDDDGDILDGEHSFGSSCSVSFHDEGNDEQYKSIVIMLLQPEISKFEILHAEYRMQSSNTVQSLLDQIPKMSSYRSMAEQRYVRLCQLDVDAFCEELYNPLSLQAHDLQHDELLVAVPEGYTSIDMKSLARALIKNQKAVRRAIRRTKRWGIRLQQIQD